MLYFDIETRGDPGLQDFVPKPEEPTKADAPNNYSKPESIAKWIEKARADREDSYQKALAGMSLDVDYAQIVAIGYAPEEMEHADAMMVTEEVPEQDVLAAFWGLDRDRPCGFNILNFDLPILIRRSCLYGIPIPQINLARYRTDSVVDLMQVLANWDRHNYRSLKHYCKLFGVPDPMPDCDGSMVAEMDDDTLAKYAAAGAEMARGLALKTRGWYWR
jgi:DNA polymerase elongation subunit (family B)